jgi:hypothetical protein
MHARFPETGFSCRHFVNLPGRSEPECRHESLKAVVVIHRIQNLIFGFGQLACPYLLTAAAVVRYCSNTEIAEPVSNGEKVCATLSLRAATPSWKLRDIKARLGVGVDVRFLTALVLIRFELYHYDRVFD